MLFRTVVGLSVLLATPAIASEWLAASYNDSSLMLVDAAGLVRTGPIVLGWADLWIRNKKTFLASDIKIQYRWDCDGKTMTQISYVNYGFEGTIRDSKQFQTYEQIAQSIAPDSLAEAALNIVCSDPSKRNDIGMLIYTTPSNYAHLYFDLSPSIMISDKAYYAAALAFLPDSTERKEFENTFLGQQQQILLRRQVIKYKK